jgi:hypothetical protein
MPESRQERRGFAIAYVPWAAAVSSVPEITV